MICWAINSWLYNATRFLYPIYAYGDGGGGKRAAIKSESEGEGGGKRAAIGGGTKSESEGGRKKRGKGKGTKDPVVRGRIPQDEFDPTNCVLMMRCASDTYALCERASMCNAFQSPLWSNLRPIASLMGSAREEHFGSIDELLLSTTSLRNVRSAGENDLTYQGVFWGKILSIYVLFFDSQQ